jgi:hypothetical protein
MEPQVLTVPELNSSLTGLSLSDKVGSSSDKRFKVDYYRFNYKERPFLIKIDCERARISEQFGITVHDDSFVKFQECLRMLFQDPEIVKPINMYKEHASANFSLNDDTLIKDEMGDHISLKDLLKCYKDIKCKCIVSVFASKFNGSIRIKYLAKGLIIKEELKSTINVEKLLED